MFRQFGGMSPVVELHNSYDLHSSMPLCTCFIHVEIKCQLDATEDFIACSTFFGHHYPHHQELKSIIQVVAACGFQVAGLVWS